MEFPENGVIYNLTQAQKDHLINHLRCTGFRTDHIERNKHNYNSIAWYRKRYDVQGIVNKPMNKEFTFEELFNSPSNINSEPLLIF